MHSVVASFPASAVSRDQLSGILNDYLAVDRARVYRRLLVRRFGGVALLAVLFGLAVHGLSPLVRWLPSAICLVIPGSAWIAELRRELRLSRRLKLIDGIATAGLDGLPGGTNKKVIKSS